MTADQTVVKARWRRIGTRNGELVAMSTRRARETTEWAAKAHKTRCRGLVNHAHSQLGRSRVNEGQWSSRAQITNETKMVFRVRPSLYGKQKFTSLSSPSIQRWVCGNVVVVFLFITKMSPPHFLRRFFRTVLESST